LRVCTYLYQFNCSDNQLVSLEVPEVELYTLNCSGNQLTSLKAHAYILNCSRNRIAGEQMDALIAALEDKSAMEWWFGKIQVYNNSKGDEQNVCTVSQVAAAAAKHWIMEYYEQSLDAWQNYAGYDPTGIEAVESGNTIDSKAPVYRLDGQRVGKQSYQLPRGIYIQNGKKLLIGGK